MLEFILGFLTAIVIVFVILPYTIPDIARFFYAVWEKIKNKQI